MSPQIPFSEVPRTQSFSRHKHTEHDFQGRFPSLGTEKGSWVRITQPHLHRTLSSNHNLSVTTVRMFETKLAYMLIPDPSQFPSFLFQNNCAAHHLIAEYFYTLSVAVVVLIFRIYSIDVSFSLRLFLLPLLSFVMKSFITNDKVCY